MRLRLTLRSAATELPWREVLRPGRLLCYTLLAEAEPELAGRLHAGGWGAYGMVPFGHGAPVFPGAARRRGRYAVGGTGAVELGSPLPAVVRAWAQAVGVRRIVDWGGAAMHVQAVELVDPPGFGSGLAVMRTTTPVVLKGSGRDADGVRTSRQAWLLPGEPEFEGYFAQGLRRKAETLGLDPDVTLERIVWVGAKRSFDVKDGKKVGAPIAVELRGAPPTLAALWSWGLGQANSAGFGWVG